MKRVVMLVGTLLLVVLAAPAADAATIKFFASLDGPSEFPPVGSPATGEARAEIDTAANTLRISASWSGLLAPTTVAHIHCCVDAPGNVGVAVDTPTLPGFPAGVTSGTYESPDLDLTDAATFNPTFVTNFGGGTAAGADAALRAALFAGRAYFNIHTTLYPGGEIRGFFHAVPAPGALGLFAAGITAAAALRGSRRRRVHLPR